MVPIGEIEKACRSKAELNLRQMRDGDVHETYADIEATSDDIPKPIFCRVANFVDWYREFYSV